MKQPVNSYHQPSAEILTSIVREGKEESIHDYFEAVRREAEEELGEQLHRLRLERMGDGVIISTENT